MIIEFPHNIDCPAVFDGACDCWVKEAKAHITKLEADNAALLEALEDVLADAENWYHNEMSGTKNYDPNAYSKRHELIRKAREK